MNKIRTGRRVKENSILWTKDDFRDLNQTGVARLTGLT